MTDARFVEKKGLLILSKAVIDLNQILDVKLTIIGLAQTHEQEEYRDLIKLTFKNAGILNKLEIPNNGKGVQIEQVIDIYQNADIFIYAGVDTGKGDVDGVPNALLQAAFSGIPVITTQSGSIGDLFDENNSYLINQNDIHDIVIKFQELLKDNQRNNKIEKLYNQAAKEFSLNINTKELEGLFFK